MALFIDKAEHISDIAKRHLVIKPVLLRYVVVGLGPTPGKSFTLGVVLQAFQLSLVKFTVKRQPLLMQFIRQGFELGFKRLPQPGDIQLAEYDRFLIEGNEFVGKAAMLHTIVQVDFARLQALPELSVNPELIAIGVDTSRVPSRVKHQQIGPQALGHRPFRAFDERLL